ncbi:MAG: hypothetical protein JWP41_1335 [Ramlibacter sp.]|jgi:hypothetical protein|nr:hypothetical protein [Ramlibacter sp.]
MNFLGFRGFVWPLAALDRKLEVQVEQARAGLADLQRRAADQARRLQSTSAESTEQARLARGALARHIDAAAHSNTLRYLGELAGRARDEEDEQRAIAARVDLARAACAALEVRRACVQEAHDSAWRVFAGTQQRREARQADLAWLGEHQRRIEAATRRAGGKA